MNCHYISIQLQQIREAGVGATLSSGGASGVEEQLQSMESAISRIRDEMWRQEQPVPLAPGVGRPKKSALI